MGSIISTVLPFLIPAVIVIAVIVVLCSGYLKAPPDMAYLISGVGKKPRILIGKAGIKIPFFERVDRLFLGAIQIDVKTSSSVPTAEFINVKVDSYVNVRVGQTDEMMSLAAQNFLNSDRDTIGQKVRDLLEGNIREIVGQMNLTDMVSDRKAFSEKVQENAVPDLARFGLELISFNVQNFSDENGVINDLGIDNIEQIRKAAAIAKSDAQREIAIAEAEKFAALQRAEAAKAEADAIKYKAMAEAEGIAAVGAAEAEAIDKKAEAQKKMGEASILEMYFDMLPKAVANAAAPLTNVDSITMYGEGNSTKMVGDVMKSTNQVMEAIQGATGIDLSTVISSYLGSKGAKSE